MCLACEAADERLDAANRLLAICLDRCATVEAIKLAFPIDEHNPPDMDALLRAIGERRQ